MADPKSFTLSKGIDAADGVQVVIDKMSWVQLAYKLSSASPGEQNRLIVGTGSSGFLVEPGDHDVLIVAPETVVRVSSDASAGEKSQWTFVVTPLPVAGLLAMVEDMRTLLQMQTCADISEQEVAARMQRNELGRMTGRERSMRRRG